MDNLEKLDHMNKIIRELEDINNSSTALLKKVAQAETENINLGNRMLEGKLPDLYEKIEATTTESASILTDFTQIRDKFVKDNKLDEEPDVN